MTTPVRSRPEAQAFEALGSRQLLVVGGRQRAPRTILDRDQGWYGYDRGVILRIGDGAVSSGFEYESAPGTYLPDDPVLLKSATVRGDRLYACTQTEVLILQLPDFELLHHISLPCFNDVHHVVPVGDDMVLVANSGLEMVLQLRFDGTIVEAWNVLGEETWSALPDGVDVRLGVDLKPHRAHPNHVFLLDGEPWATRFELRDAISLVDPTRRIDVGQERIHDGVVHDGQVLFTTVDGYLVVADATTLAVTDRIKLEVPADAVGGWCRGLLVDGEHVWVGYSRIRPTRFRQSVSWVRSGLQRSCPTRIARHRRSDGRLDGEIDLEPHGINAVFTVAFA